MISVFVIVACLVLAALAVCLRMAALTDRADDPDVAPEHLRWTAADDDMWRILASRPYEK